MLFGRFIEIKILAIILSIFESLYKIRYSILFYFYTNHIFIELLLKYQ